MLPVLKVAIAACVISITSWLAGKRPELAGFIIALPIASLLALAFSHLEHHNTQASVTFAKSILIGVPVSWLFFAPFFVAERWGLGFWGAYALGIALLVSGYFVHKYALGLIS
ncbi:MAG: hypothetical protein GC134_00615 [Proteobacteria bacterium]|nr:hypothetical protein [Pseudomonadota bacterium]